MALQLDFSSLSDAEKDEHDGLIVLVQAYFTVIEDMKAHGLLSIEDEATLTGRMDACQRRVDALYERIGLAPLPPPRLVT